MPVHLTAAEVRVVGSLLEKEVTTPDTYPLTRNALVAACNQTTGRAPVLQLGHEEVEEALRRLKEEGMVRVVHPSHGSRSEKYRHVLPEVLELGGPERTVLCLLALRGPQTPGELKARSDRLSGFAEIRDLLAELHAAAEEGDTLARGAIAGLFAGGSLAVALGACGTDAVPQDADLIALDGTGRDWKTPVLMLARRHIRLIVPASTGA